MKTTLFAARPRTFVRIAVLIATVAAILVRPIAAPARTITVRTPQTLSRSVVLGADRGRAVMSIRPTHIHFSWRGDEGTGVRYRTSPTDRWRIAPVDEDAGEGDLHYSAVIGVARPEQLEYRSVVPKGAEMGPIEFDYVNTVDGPLTTRTIKVPVNAARAAARTPNIRTRAQWGADESIKRANGGCKRVFYPVQQLFVHHTAGNNFVRNGAATMRAIYQFHVRSRGWCDLGYNFVIDWDGTIYEGRWARAYGPWETHTGENVESRAAMGAHVGGYNSGSVGISLMGNFQNVSPPPAMRRSLIRMLAWESDRHRFHPNGRHTYRNPDTGIRRRLPRIAGHRDAGSTACPGARLYGRLPSIRRAAADVAGSGKRATKVRLASSAGSIRAGERVTFSGRLIDENGAGLRGRPTRLYRRWGTGGWRPAKGPTTGPGGRFSFHMRPLRNLRVAAVYPGGRKLWGSQSRFRAVAVRHVLTIQVPDRPIGSDGAYHYSGEERRATVRGKLSPSHAGKRIILRVRKAPPGGTFREVLEVPVRLGGNSGYRYEYTIPDRRSGTTYRVRVSKGNDSEHAAGESPVAVLRID